MNAYARIQEAVETGRAWGEQEVELWRDQHGDATMPDWTLGTYCGTLPNDESRELIEAVIDIEARRVWNAAREFVVDIEQIKD